MNDERDDEPRKVDLEASKRMMDVWRLSVEHYEKLGVSVGPMDKSVGRIIRRKPKQPREANQ